MQYSGSGIGAIESQSYGPRLNSSSEPQCMPSNSGACMYVSYELVEHLGHLLNSLTSLVNTISPNNVQAPPASRQPESVGPEIPGTLLERLNLATEATKYAKELTARLQNEVIG